VGAPVDSPNESVIERTRDEFIHKSELEQFKLELIMKINRRFEMEEEREKNKKIALSDPHLIPYTPIQFDDFDMSHDMSV
jgi:hypothetical protein